MEGIHTLKDLLRPWRLASQGRSQGCFLYYPSTPIPQKIPSVHSSEPNLRIHLPPIRPHLSTLGLYQDPEAGCSPHSRAGDASDFLHRQHSHHGGDTGSPPRSDHGLIYLLQNLGFTINAKKTLLEPTQAIEFLGFMVDMIAMELSLPGEKMKKIRAEACKLKGEERVSARA